MRRRRPKPPSDQREARWLLEHLTEASEPAKPAGVVTAAGEAGFSRATLYRARRALGGAIEDVGTGPRDPHKRWVLAELAGPDKDNRTQ